MARRSQKSKPSMFEAFRMRNEDGESRISRRALRIALKLMFVVAILAAAGYGLTRLEIGVRASAQTDGPARIVFSQRPESMVAITDAALERFADVPWSRESLCNDIAATLYETCWVRSVDRVHRFPDGRIEVSCDFREPIGLVQSDSGFTLIDADCVRLPGWYTNAGGYPLIVGVRAPAPEAGATWSGDDIRAGVQIVRYLAAQEFADQLTGVLVDNFGGRYDPTRAQIVLATDQAGGRIIWGSPIGEEVEENSAAEKLALLRANYRRFGHVGAGRSLIDVSIHPDRVVVPASGASVQGSYAGL